MFNRNVIKDQRFRGSIIPVLYFIEINQSLVYQVQTVRGAYEYSDKNLYAFSYYCIQLLVIAFPVYCPYFSLNLSQLTDK
jgi:hypothetical protein